VADIEPYLRSATVFVLPSLTEQSGSLALLEAMQVGLPVVASACDGIPEDVRHGHDALLVPPGSVNGLADTLEYALADVDLRRRLGREASRTFEARFSATRIADALGRLYSEELELAR
jgi:glycosyltransferase involved in cell wall biosynthesis